MTKAMMSLLLLVSLAGVQPALAGANDLSTEMNVKYGEAGGHPLLLDVFRAAGETSVPRPAIVLIHGGGWVGGSKEVYHQDARWFAAKGYVCFAAGYRLVKETTGTWPQQIDDVQLAVRWVRANAAEYGVDPDRVAAMGASAGGHLVSCLGTMDTRDVKAPLAGFASRPECVVDVFGPVNLTSDFPTSGPFGMNVQKLVTNMLGDPANARAASPHFLIDARTAPFLVLHGSDDAIVPVSQSREFVQALKKNGTEVVYVEVPKAGHGFAAKDREMTLDATLKFLDAHLKEERSAGN